MYCQCPACNRTTQVQPEQLDHLVRCDRCRAMFIARTTESTELAQQLAAEMAIPMPPGPDHVHLAEILTRTAPPRRPAPTPVPEPEAPSTEPAAPANLLESVAQEQRLTEAVREQAKPTHRQKELAAFQLRWQRHALGIIGLCGLLAIILLACLVILLNNHLRQASASPSFHAAAPVPAPSATTQSDTPAAEPTAQATVESSGELFPDIKPSN